MSNRPRILLDGGYFGTGDLDELRDTLASSNPGFDRSRLTRDPDDARAAATRAIERHACRALGVAAGETDALVRESDTAIALLGALVLTLADPERAETLVLGPIRAILGRDLDALVGDAVERLTTARAVRVAAEAAQDAALEASPDALPALVDEVARTVRATGEAADERRRERRVQRRAARLSESESAPATASVKSGPKRVARRGARS